MVPSPATQSLLIAESSGSEDNDYDSLYGSGIGTDTTSLSSSITKYRYENGRRYHAYSDGKYWAPNDDKQNGQLDIFHHIYSLVLEGDLFRAPIGNDPQNILDLGTGTGIWAIDMADKFPSARIIGNDLSPIQPEWVPPNLQFEIDDFTKEWAHQPNSFDFVHARALYGSIGDWPQFISRAYEVTKPGGWFESVETTVEHLSDDNSIPKDSVVLEWGRNYKIAEEKIGKSFTLEYKIKPWMEEQGFINVVEKEYKVPVGPWPLDKHLKEIGKYNLLNMLEAAEGFTMAIYTRVLGWDPVEVHALLGQVRAEYLNRKVHGYYRLFVVYGQKPEDAGKDAL
ncbi:S-adenosyl-L-methionine-dependent methyltransferase [Morchella snyderi]|nr:S-adenosyl-L-methionine-dependent methyltransferase [Morchella snyderi]